MTVIDRDLVEVPSEERRPLPGAEAAPEPMAPAAPFSEPGRMLFAALSAAAGVIHLAMVPAHATEWLPEGIAFAVAGWLQFGLAIGFFVRPSARLLRVSVVANLAFIAAWAVTRISGMPWGPEAGTLEKAGLVDVSCVTAEVLLIVVGYELIARPDRWAGLSARGRKAFGLLPIAVLVVSSAAIASPSATHHTHGTPAGGTTSAAAATGAGEHAAEHAQGTTAPVDDKGLSLIMNGKGEGGGHTHTFAEVPVDAATQRELDAQLAQTRPLIEKYPTVKDAEAAGYFRSGPFSPGLGAHYTSIGQSLNLDGKMDANDLAHPFLIYDGIEPDSKLAGFMYMAITGDLNTAPEGFAGPNDHWHYHENVCIVARPGGGIDSPLGADTTATKALCDTYGGTLIANTGYMVHVWPVPGYESPQGMFSNVNAKITCADGTYHIVDPEQIGHRTSTCLDA